MRYFVTVFTVLGASVVHGDEVDRHLAILAKLGPQGLGSIQARSARDALLTQDSNVLPRLLDAMDTDNVVAANWCRAIFDKVVARELDKEEPNLPVEKLRSFVTDPDRAGRARRLALTLVDRLEPGFEDRVIPTLLDDPEFRTDAVARTLDAANAVKKDDELEAKELFQSAFKHARDSGQITRAADGLKSLGVEASIIDHMGFVTRWHLLGPFDAPGTSGFEREFPPEKSVSLAATYDGKDGEKIAWKLYETSDRFGQVNLIQSVKAVKEAVGYAYAELTADEEQHVQVRCGADDNLSAWLNGEKIFSRKQWLNGTRLDRFTAPATLKKGKNTLLVKVCQGPQHVNPAVPNNWSMQLRFCDATGAAAKFINITPPADSGE